MKNKKVLSLREKIIEGMRISSIKLIRRKKQLDLKVVISENEVIKEIATEDLK